MAMLDLQAFQKQTYEVKLFDGEVIHLLKPSQKLVLEILAHEEKIKSKGNPAEVLTSFIAIILDILNNNDEGRKFNKGYVEKFFSLEIGMVFVESYMGFVQEVNSNPN